MIDPDVIAAIMEVLRIHDLMSARRCACGATFDPDDWWTEGRRHVAEQIETALTSERAR